MPGEILVMYSKRRNSASLCKPSYNNHYPSTFQLFCDPAAVKLVWRCQARTGRPPTTFGAPGCDTSRSKPGAVSQIEGLFVLHVAGRAKSAVVIRIGDQGAFESYVTENP